MDDVPQYELAELDYINGMKYQEIADKYGVSINTVKSWKTRYKWCKPKSTHTTEKVRTQNKKVCTQNKVGKSPPKKIVQEVMIPEAEVMIENNGLTDKQKLFCIYMTRYFNATKAYQKAYGCSYATAMAEGSKHLRNPKIQDEISKIKQAKMNRMALDPSDIFQKYMDIAFSDITDYLTFGKKTVEYVDKAGNNHEIEVSYVDLNESSQVDGTLISEVKQGKDGVSIKLADRMKALAWIADHMDLATEEQKARIALLKVKVTQDDEDEEQEDDGFIEALKGQVSGVWDE